MVEQTSWNEIKANMAAPVEDDFTYTFHTKDPRPFKKRILNLFNQKWTEGKLPEKWKTAILIHEKKAPPHFPIVHPLKYYGENDPSKN